MAIQSANRHPIAAALASALLVSSCGGGGGSSSSSPPPAPALPPPPPVSGPQYVASAASPFAPNCNDAAQTGTLYTNAEVEPSVAVNPQNPSNLIGVWQQDRWSNGSAQGLMTGASFDGGMTWTRIAVPFARCAGGNAANGGGYQRVSDPWVTISPNGIAYQIALSSSGGVLQPGSSSAVLVSRSNDGGRTWENPVTLIQDGSQFFNDKESITADPTDARFVYAAWDRLASAGGGPAYFARTTDGGLTWELARAIYDPGAASQTLNNQIAVLPNGTLVNFFTQIDTAPNNTATAFLAVIRSTDKGTTWSAPTRIADSLALGTRDPDTDAAIRDGANLGSIAVTPGGDLVAVWQDARFSGGVRDGIAFARSADGGLTWSQPTRINGNTNVQAFIPTVHVRADGTIGVSYYDLRSNTSDPATLLTDYWLARSTDGVTWRDSRVAGPFDLAVAPNARGLFLGDYQALTSVGAVFVPFYVQTNSGTPANRTDVFAELATMLSSGTALEAVEKRVLEAEARLPAMLAEVAAPVRMDSQLRQRLHESIVRTMQRRVPAWEEMLQRQNDRPEKP